MTVLTLRPSGAGDEYNCSNSGYGTKGNNYTYVDEDPANDSDYTFASSATLRDLHALPNHSTESGTINSVKIYCRFKLNMFTTGSAKICLKSGGTVVDGTTQTLTFSFAAYSQTWTTNPVTSSAWTWDEIDALQAGYKLIADAGSQANCSQMYVEVDYTETAGTVIPVFMNQYRQRR